MKQLQLKDFLNYRFLSEPQWAPDGRRAAFVVSTCDEEENDYASRLYLLDERGAVRPLTGMGKESGYAWLDATHILFPAVRSPREKKRAEAKEQFTPVYCIDVTGGEAQPAFTLPFAARRMRVLDSGHLAVLGLIDAACPDYAALSAEDRAAADKARGEEADYEVLDEVPFCMNGAGYTNKKRSALFLVTLSPFSVRRVSEPLTNVGAVEVLGDEVFFDGDEFRTRENFYSFRLRALNWRTGEVREVASSDEMSLSSVRAVGAELWVSGTDGRRHGCNENAWVWRMDPATGAMTILRREEYNMYGSVGSDCRYGGGEEQAAHGGALYHVATRGGDALLYRLTASGASEPVITKSGSVDCFAVSAAHDRALLVALYDMRLQELYCADLATGEITQLTHLNDDVLADTYVAEPQALTVHSEGLDIEGWVLLPKDFDPKKSYPAVLDVHGGPKTVYGPVFYHEMQLWANMGYFVFFCNPKGSDGRDNAFMDIFGHYGETDYRNLMDFTDAVLAAYPQIDPKRVCETGGSYGGFMTNWIIGHTDRFCCAASQRSISNWLSFTGTGDIGWFFVADQNRASIYDDPAKLWEHSPLKYARAVRTPTLFIHSDQDYRCPLEQGLQMYSALVDLGVPARMCLFHGENHELSRSGKPKHRVRRLTEITDWFEKWSAAKRAE